MALPEYAVTGFPMKESVQEGRDRACLEQNGPAYEALGKLEPGLYVMTAQSSTVEVESYDNIATQWFVVSDLGLSTMSGKDGLHVGVRSIATAMPLADVEVRLIARNNEILASAKSNADGIVVFEAGLQNGEGGMAPALVVATAIFRRTGRKYGDRS